MADEWIDLNGPLALRRATDELLACNAWIGRFGLTVTPTQAAVLVQARREALKSCGRLELGAGTLPALLFAFADSPYLDQDNMAETMAELLELFYTYKNETLDVVGDDELIAYMRDEFNGRCKGRLELLEGWSLARLARRIRLGIDDEDDEDADEETE